MNGSQEGRYKNRASSQIIRDSLPTRVYSHEDDVHLIKVPSEMEAQVIVNRNSDCQHVSKKNTDIGKVNRDPSNDQEIHLTNSSNPLD